MNDFFFLEIVDIFCYFFVGILEEEMYGVEVCFLFIFD